MYAGVGYGERAEKGGDLRTAQTTETNNVLMVVSISISMHLLGHVLFGPMFANA